MPAHHADRTDHNTVWFGVSMVLIGVIAGYVLASLNNGGFAPSRQGSVPTANAPLAPNAPTNGGQGQGLSNELYASISKTLGLNVDVLQSCLSSNKYASYVQNEMTEGQKAGVNGTPGNILLDLKKKKAYVVSGAQPLAVFSTVIDDILAGRDVTLNPASASVVDFATVPSLDLANDHIRGDEKASIALIEYSDFECPFCKSVHPTLQQLLEKYDGKLMWVYRFFPLSFHPNAQKAAEASQCVYEQGGNKAFWEFADALFQNQG